MTPPAQATLRLSPRDHVAVATSALTAGSTIATDSGTATVAQDIPPGHKVALVDRSVGQWVTKYGYPIGKATAAITAGQWVHSHNLRDEHDDHGGAHHRGTDHRGTWDDSTRFPLIPLDESAAIERTWMGYDRGDGRYGTRNYVGVISTVNCSASVCHAVVGRFDADRMKRWPHVDGVFAATHPSGCAMQYNGLKHQMLARVLSGYAMHANVAATLVVGLGCEQTTPGYLRERGLVQIGGADTDTATPSLSIQTAGGTRATIDRAEAALVKLLDQANQARRTSLDAKHLTLAMECGGSDAYSGITANPAVGIVSDRIVACGGTSVVSETTELYGAEHLLVQRAVSRQVAEDLLDRIEWWKQHTSMHGVTLDNNPSVGNKAGGLTTITEKSLGAVSKTGHTAMRAVYQYAQPIDQSGLVIMDSPGFDPASVTGKVAGGANLVLFTTGRGSCFGGKPVPVVKVASNTPLFESMPDDMDFDAGRVLVGDSVEATGEALFEHALRVASGETTCSERLGMGDHEFVPWTVGPTL